MSVTNVKIVPGTNIYGGFFSDVFITFEREGVENVAYSRIPYPIGDSPHTRAAQVQEFLRRQQMRSHIQTTRRLAIVPT